MKVRLEGVLEHTVSWAEIQADGNLVIELYDFSSEAEERLGREASFFLIIPAASKAKILLILLEGEAQGVGEADRDAVLLRLLQERFADYFAVKRWLREQRIPWRDDFDPNV